MHALYARPRSADAYAGALYLVGLWERQNMLLGALLKAIQGRPLL